MAHFHFHGSRALLAVAGLIACASVASAQSYVTPVAASPDAPPPGSGLPNMDLTTLLRAAGIGSYVHADASQNGGNATDQIFDRMLLSTQFAPTSLEILLPDTIRAAESDYAAYHRIGLYQTTDANVAPAESSVRELVWESGAAVAGSGGVARLSTSPADFSSLDPSLGWFLRLNSDTPGADRGGAIYSVDALNPGGYKNVVFLQERTLAGDLVADSYVLAFEDLLGGGDRDYNDIVIRVRATRIPEPGALALAGFGLIAVAGTFARRKATRNR